MTSIGMTRRGVVDILRTKVLLDLELKMATKLNTDDDLERTANGKPKRPIQRNIL